MVKEILKGDFEREVILSEKPVVADFWAPWCGYCRRMAPMFDRLEQEHGEKISFVKINVDDNADLAEKFGVDTIPRLMLFINGTARAQVVSPASQDEVEQWLSENGALDQD